MVLARDNERKSFYAAMSAQEHDLKKKGGGEMESKERELQRMWDNES